MSLAPGRPTPARAQALAIAGLSRPGSPFRDLPARLVVVDVGWQRLTLLESGLELGLEVADYPISTATNGIGGEENSMRTPPGWHRIHARIGAGAPSGTVFESREPTGARWRGERVEDDLILTRILTLEGLEEGVNRGPGHDSLARYIYVHGTNHEDTLGQPGSHGCIRMANADVIDLFARVEAGDPVLVAGYEDAPVA